jgi:hypothetical protein
VHQSALTVSPKLTATPPRVPADIVQISPLRIAPAPDPPADGNTFVAALFPLSSHKPTTNPSAYVFAEFKVLVSAAACAVETGLFASEYYLHYLLIMKSLLYQQLNLKFHHPIVFSH